jgi:hypothetical protein
VTEELAQYPAICGQRYGRGDYPEYSLQKVTYGHVLYRGNYQLVLLNSFVFDGSNQDDNVPH